MRRPPRSAWLNKKAGRSARNRTRLYQSKACFIFVFAQTLVVYFCSSAFYRQYAIINKCNMDKNEGWGSSWATGTSLFFFFLRDRLWPKSLVFFVTLAACCLSFMFLKNFDVLELGFDRDAGFGLDFFDNDEATLFESFLAAMGHAMGPALGLGASSRGRCGRVHHRLGHLTGCGLNKDDRGQGNENDRDLHDVYFLLSFFLWANGKADVYGRKMTNGVWREENDGRGGLLLDRKNTRRDYRVQPWTTRKILT